MKKHDPKFETSLYNHKPLCEDGKPLISNAEYAILFEAVKRGEFEKYHYAETQFTFEPKQRKFIEDIIKKRIV